MDTHAVAPSNPIHKKKTKKTHKTRTTGRLQLGFKEQRLPVTGMLGKSLRNWPITTRHSKVQGWRAASGPSAAPAILAATAGAPGAAAATTPPGTAGPGLGLAAGRASCPGSAGAGTTKAQPTTGRASPSSPRSLRVARRKGRPLRRKLLQRRQRHKKNDAWLLPNLHCLGQRQMDNSPTYPTSLSS